MPHVHSTAESWPRSYCTSLSPQPSPPKAPPKHTHGDQSKLPIKGAQPRWNSTTIHSPDQVDSRAPTTPLLDDAPNENTPLHHPSLSLHCTCLYCILHTILHTLQKTTSPLCCYCKPRIAVRSPKSQPCRTAHKRQALHGRVAGLSPGLVLLLPCREGHGGGCQGHRHRHAVHPMRRIVGHAHAEAHVRGQDALGPVVV